MIVRIIVLLAVILAVLYLIDSYRQLRQGSGGRPEELRGSRPRPSTSGPPDGDLVGCAACGVHVPASRALWSGAGGRRRAFCSPACRGAGAGR